MSAHLSVWKNVLEKKEVVKENAVCFRFSGRELLISIDRRKEKKRFRALVMNRKDRYEHLKQIEKMTSDLTTQDEEEIEVQMFLDEVVSKLEIKAKRILCSNHREILKLNVKLNKPLKIVLPSYLTESEMLKCQRASKASLFAFEVVNMTRDNYEGVDNEDTDSEAENYASP